LVQSKVEGARGGFWARTALASRAVPKTGAADRPRVLATSSEPRSAEPMSAEVMTVGRLFDGRFRFRLPCFQRGYAWRPENVTRLLADLRWAIQQDKRKRFYPLGRLMLAARPGSSDVEIIDGHQRMVTLTMLLSVLRDLETDSAKAERLHNLIADETRSADDPARFILAIQALPAKLFERIVQRRGATDDDPEVPREALSEFERNIVDNRECIRSELLAPGVTEEFRRDLTAFLLDRCNLIVVVTDDAEEAWEMLNTEQNTRLAFNHADEAKSAILSAMPAGNHVAAAQLWESCESMLAPEDMYRLLCHIRAIAWRGKSQSSRPVEMELIERFGIATDGLGFIFDHLAPFASRLRDVRRGAVGGTDLEREALSRFFDYMTWIDLHSWMPPLLLWTKVRGPASPDTLDFVQRLDRLVWISKIGGVDPGVQETRFLRLMDEIDKGLRPAAMSRLVIEPKMRADAISNLRSANFAAKHYAGYLLRRVSCLMGEDPGPIVRDEVTIEHILPRNPHGCRAWLNTFRTPEICKSHHQKLGNVVLLSGRENQQAGTLSWDEKRQILARSSFSLAREAATEREWTAQTITRRTERLIDLLLQSFDLPRLNKSE
jgi:hypothetical protein